MKLKLGRVPACSPLPSRLYLLSRLSRLLGSPDWSRRDTSDIDGLSREAETSGERMSQIAADLKRDYFAAGFFSSTRTTSIGPVPMFSGRCAPAGVKTASPFLPDISSLLPSG